jgi:hypothetical protein
MEENVVITGGVIKTGVAGSAPEIAAPNTRSWKYFAEQINAAWRKGPEAIIEAARYICEAGEELDRDQFEALLKLRLAFDASVGRKLKRIGENKVLCAHGHKLPACWTTIYELSKVPDDTLKAAIADGRVHSGMQRKDAVALRKPPRDESPGGPEESGENDSPLSPPPPDPKLPFAAAWDAASSEEIRAKLDAVGRDGLCKVLSETLKAELRDFILGQNIASAPQRSSFAINATDKLQVALRCAELKNPDSEAVGHMTGALRCIALTAERRKVARSDIVVAIASRKPKHRREK